MRKIILSLLGVLLIVGAYFLGQIIIKKDQLRKRLLKPCLSIRFKIQM
jgi:hypothetical protein